MVFLRQKCLACCQGFVRIPPSTRGESCVSFTGRSSMRQLFAAVTILAAVGAVRATDGEVKCKADGVHLCCAKCEKSVTEILTKVNGVTKITCDRKGKAVTFEAKDKKTADDAVAALLNGGFIGKMTVDGKEI